MDGEAGSTAADKRDAEMSKVRDKIEGRLDNVRG